MDFNKALEGARELYHDAVYDYNSYVESCGVMLVQDLTEQQKERLEILLDRTIVMQDYFKNVLEARNIFDSLED